MTGELEVGAMSALTVVVENTSIRPGLVVEHGLSLWLEHEGVVVLYDTGAGRALLTNMAMLGLDPGRIDAVVLSHGHFDHTGGLGALLELRRASGMATPVWCHRTLFSPHLKQTGDRLGDIGPPRGSAKAYASLEAEFNFIDEPYSPWPGITLLAPIPRQTDFEGALPGLMTLDADGEVRPDPFDDELALAITGTRGLAVIIGCAHAGVINVLLAAEAHANREVATLVGGTHLGPVPEEQRERTIEAFASFPDLRVVTGHCTGQAVVTRLAALLADRLVPLQAGLTLEL